MCLAARESFFEQSGLLLPNIHLQPDAELLPNTFQLAIGDQRIPPLKGSSI
jgi:hypothetical protein